MTDKTDDGPTGERRVRRRWPKMGKFGVAATAVCVLWFAVMMASGVIGVVTANPASAYDPEFFAVVEAGLANLVLALLGVVIGLATLIFSRELGAGILAGTGLGASGGFVARFAAAFVVT